MPAAQTHVGPDTPMGATLLAGGCVFRAWAPRAEAVYVTGSFNQWQTHDEACLLVRDGRGYWAGFIPGLGRGTEYKFFVIGPGNEGHKRDPYAPRIVAGGLELRRLRSWRIPLARSGVQATGLRRHDHLPDACRYFLCRRRQWQ